GLFQNVGCDRDSSTCRPEKPIHAQEPGCQSHATPGGPFQAFVHQPELFGVNRVLGHQAGDLLSPEHADDVEPAVLQSIQREGFIRPRGRWVSASVAIKGARLPLLVSNTATSNTRANSSGLSMTSLPLDHRPTRCAASLIAVLLRCFRAPPRCCLAMARKWR